MKTQHISILSAIFLAVMLCISPAWCGSPGAVDQQVSYETFVDQQIQHNEFKSTLGSATSPNLQKNAEVSRVKADFLRKNRDVLISNMDAADVEKKPYKMSRYLNQSFYDSYGVKGPLLGEVVVEAYEEP